MDEQFEQDLSQAIAFFTFIAGKTLEPQDLSSYDRALNTAFFVGIGLPMYSAAELATYDLTEPQRQGILLEQGFSAVTTLRSKRAIPGVVDAGLAGMVLELFDTYLSIRSQEDQGIGCRSLPRNFNQPGQYSGNR